MSRSGIASAMADTSGAMDPDPAPRPSGLPGPGPGLDPRAEFDMTFELLDSPPAEPAADVVLLPARESVEEHARSWRTIVDDALPDEAEVVGVERDPVSSRFSLKVSAPARSVGAAAAAADSVISELRGGGAGGV